MVDHGASVAFITMERTVLLPITALILCAAVQASPTPQLAERDGAGSHSAVRATTHSAKPRRTSPSGFEENKGQVKQTDGQLAPHVKFRLSDGNTRIFLLERGIAYQFNRMHDPEGYAELAHRGHLSSEDETKLNDLRKQRRLETYRMDMTLEGADPHASITTEGRSADFTNYYLSGVEALDVRTFRKVVYHGVYPGIDWEIMTTEKGFEQDFIVHPGADPSSIKMRFAGHEELYVDEQGALVHGNRLGRFVEEGPVSYQGIAEVGTAFNLQNDLLAFEIGGYDKSRDLRIDPTREWGTYYGGTGNEEVKDVASAEDGNVYMAGWTDSPESDVIAATTGVEDLEYNGGTDGFLVKFAPDGDRIWGTYYGGGNNDFLVSCAVHGDQVIAAGTSNSTGLGTNGTQQEDFAFSQFGDALLVNFDTGTGARNWATYYGGQSADAGYSCAVDPWGYFYLAGKTAALPGGSDTIAFDGFQMEMQEAPDFFLAKFDSLGRRKWGTYYGGFSDDVNSNPSVATDGSGAVILAGHCGYNAADGSTFVSPGAHHMFHGTSQWDGIIVAGGDAFVAKFDSSGSRDWGTYYGGRYNETCWTCSVDGEGNIYISGETKSDTGIYSAGHKPTLATAPGIQDDAYLAKFGPNGQLIWGTYYGGGGTDEIRTIATDALGHVFMAGGTKSTEAISFGGYQMDHSTGPINADGLIVGFTTDGERILGSYYGGSSDDQIYGSTFDPSGALLVCGWSSSSGDTTISSSNAFQPLIGSTKDAFLAKFRPDCRGVAAGDHESGSPCDDEEICTLNDVYNSSCVCAGTFTEVESILGNSILGTGIPYTFTVDPVLPGVEYHWVIPDGWAVSDTVGASVTITIPYNGAGTGEFGVWGINGACVLDTATQGVLIEEVIGVEEQGLGGLFTIQPNPGNGRFELVRTNGTSGVLHYDLLDATGRATGRSGSITGPRVTLDLGQASAGVYFLRLRHNAVIDVLRLVLQH